MKYAQIEALICDVLRGGIPPWPAPEETALAEAFLARGQYHGVQALLHERLCNVEGWPAAILQRLREQAVAQAMWEMRHQQVLAEVLAKLVNVGIQPVLFKGTALAYSLYDNPVLRTRGDTDFIIAPADKARVVDALASLGFKRFTAASRDFSSYQAAYTLQIEGGGGHTLDVHWRINDSELLSRLFSFDELRQQALALPALSPHALAAGPAHALLLACIHRAMHMETPYYVDGVAYFSGNRLIWLYDIHLLAQALRADQWDEFSEIAERKGLRAVCLDAFERARACFHTAVPESVLAALAKPGPTETVSGYLNASIAKRHWLDFWAIEGSAGKLRLIRELFFPSAVFMRNRFPDAKVKWLPWLYARRVFEGVRIRLERGRRTP
jgi:uncharacterized protein YhfF